MSIAVVVAAVALTGCGETNSVLPTAPSSPALSSPTSSSRAPATSATVAQQQSFQPAPAGSQPTITSIKPNVASTSGSWGAITGTGFEPGATLTIGGNHVLAVFRDSNKIEFASSGAH